MISLNLVMDTQVLLRFWIQDERAQQLHFRFDIDGLLVMESEDPNHLPVKFGFASKRPGRMHACGHDRHAALGLAIAKWLIQHKEELKGTFKKLFSNRPKKASAVLQPSLGLESLMM